MSTSDPRQNPTGEAAQVAIANAIEVVRDPAGTSNDLGEYERSARLLADLAERAIRVHEVHSGVEGQFAFVARTTAKTIIGRIDFPEDWRS